MEEEQKEDVKEEIDYDIRWKQRFNYYTKAFGRMTEAITIIKHEPNHFLLQAGLIQTFEYTFELGWKTLKDYLESEGFHVSSPKHAIRKAFQCGFISDAKPWLKALNDRNMMAHSYYEDVSLHVVSEIQDKYYDQLKELHEWLGNLVTQD